MDDGLGLCNYRMFHDVPVITIYEVIVYNDVLSLIIDSTIRNQWYGIILSICIRVSRFGPGDYSQSIVAFDFLFPK